MNNNPLKVCVIIPARFESSRFPGKPLVKLNKISMVVRVAQLSSKAVGKNNVFVATDDIRIVKEVELSGFKAIITSSSALTGTDRVAEAARQLNYDIYVNVQGDEPLLDFNDIIKCIDLKVKYPKYIVNGYTKLSEQENPDSVNIPKVITNEKNFLVYMSRKSLPGFKDKKNSPKIFYKQVCIYGFNKQQLFDFNSFGNKSVLEDSEDIEILRFLEFDYKILMYRCKSGSIAVDIPEDIAKVEQVLKENENF
jgi:3-deoxy-manno-octulosonate cytidylyltransferase (CMP-KDO synthetase)